VGVSVVPRSSAGTAGPAARVVPLADPAAVHQVSAVYDRKRLAPAAAAFLEMIDRHRTDQSA
jgi:DNA-binding transcriptional LysR family regulator